MTLGPRVIPAAVPCPCLGGGWLLGPGWVLVAAPHALLWMPQHCTQHHLVCLPSAAWVLQPLCISHQITSPEWVAQGGKEAVVYAAWDLFLLWSRQESWVEKELQETSSWLLCNWSTMFNQITYCSLLHTCEAVCVCAPSFSCSPDQGLVVLSYRMHNRNNKWHHMSKVCATESQETGWIGSSLLTIHMNHCNIMCLNLFVGILVCSVIMSWRGFEMEVWVAKYQWAGTGRTIR